MRVSLLSYDSQRFSGVNLSEETLSLNTGSVLGRDLTLYNRALLSDVFATEIIKSPAFPNNYLNIIAPVGAVGSVLIDGVALPTAAFSPIPGGLYVGAQVKIASGLHRVSSPEPVGVIGYGWGEYDAYGWPACIALGDVTPPEVTGPSAFSVTVAEDNVVGIQGCTAIVPDLRGKVSMVDNCELSPNSGVQQNPAPGTQVGVGMHPIQFSVSDVAGNIGFGETVITVTGGGEPTLVVPTNITVNAQSSTGARVAFEAYAMRSCGDKTPLVCDPPSNSLFPPGKTTVKCRLEDPDYPLSASFDVVVAYSAQIKLVYTLNSQELQLQWDAVATLQRADNILGPWTDVKATNSYRISTSANAREFYRLKLSLAGMVWIPSGTFRMGSPLTESEWDSVEDPQTQVTISKGFWMSRYETTQQEYLGVMGSNPSYCTGDLNRPVEQITWNDATNYCGKLTNRERLAGRLPAGYEYRLPTEAEWEYACRAGTTTRFSYGDDLSYSSLRWFAWYVNNGGLTTHPVGEKLPNAWGLYDMHGNVSEYCLDWYGTYPGGNGLIHVVRIRVRIA